MGSGDSSGIAASSMVLDKLLNPSTPRIVYKMGWGALTIARLQLYNLPTLCYLYSRARRG